MITAFVAFVVGDLREITLDNDFDALIGRLILSHQLEPESTLRSLAEHLKPGGVVAFEEPDHTPGGVRELSALRSWRLVPLTTRPSN